MVCCRAFEDWAEAGCEGWSPDHVLPHFRMLEDDLAFGDEPWHGKGGPIPVYRAPQESWGPVDLALRDAALAQGHPWCDDLNAPDALGVCTYAINSRDGRRVSTADGYLEPVRDRPNLTILGDALVDQVLLEGRQATGVRVRRHGEITELKAPSGDPVRRLRAQPGDPDAQRDRPRRAPEGARHLCRSLTCRSVTGSSITRTCGWS